MILKMHKTIQEALEEGYTNDPMECAATICQRASKVFGVKLKEQKVKGLEGATWLVSMSSKYDSAFIHFRGHFFDTHLNVELLDAGLEALYYVLVTDSEKIKEYTRIVKLAEQGKDPVHVDYAWKKEAYLN